ncbi:hypothetical protein Pla123a_18210 [Posidoniimonas polymericola]|uniref:Uncharacterized protein n=1 Tax=Posidoniimonas polymericola TaxID=2528002 RepID=A0A5C5YT91_9BACT|nr:hypothetical protein Pla123a_18210 [Posidoniimonas polymericola]
MASAPEKGCPTPFAARKLTRGGKHHTNPHGFGFGHDAGWAGTPDGCGW